MGDNGEVCDNEKEVIRSHNECYIAIHKLGLQVAVQIWTGSLSDDIPTGCSMRHTENLGGIEIDFHFENTDHGLGTGRYDLRPVCKQRNAGYFYIKTNRWCKGESID